MTEARADESAAASDDADSAAEESEARPAYELQHLRPDPLEIPRLAPDVEPIGGVIRAEIEDFEVEEIPLYRPSGEGEHVYLTIRKRNRTTLQIRQFLSQVLGVKDEDIGFAGFKDKRGITTQAFSVLGIEEERVERIHPAEWIEVLEVGRHSNKLRPGHLEGNKFRIRVREARAGSIDDAKRIVDCVRERGLPNFYHGQRFGRGYVGARTGHALIHRDVDRVVGLLVGNEAGVPEPFRDAFEAGEIEKALELLPPGRAAEAAVLHALRRYPDNNRAAARRIPRQLRKMYFSAYQSFLYNWALRERWSWGGEPY
ncbi:MAG: tRNA pseudouridine(13) synthase TruD, partial [Planctomycetota bacterium]